MAKRSPPLPPKLVQRRSAQRDPTPRIWVLTEGRNTEPSYLNAFKVYAGNSAVKVEIVGGVGTPMTIVRDCLQRKRELSRSPTSVKDQVWAVFDRDTHPEIDQAINAAHQGGVYVAYSNPCFELWAILHHCDHDAPLNSAEAQKKLSNLMPSYSHNKSAKLDFDKLSKGYADACKRATSMRRRREEERSPRQNPFTNVDVLTQMIAEFGKAEKRAAIEKGRRLSDRTTASPCKEPQA